MLDTLLNYHKRKLDLLIEKGESYEKILKQSRIVDKYVNLKMEKINKFNKNKKI